MRHEFIESFPETLEEGKLYVSMRYRTAAHLCACGCGRKVVTPIRKHAWKLTYDGESITLHPSIGSRSLACRSHYYIRNGKVLWLRKMGEYDELEEVAVEAECEEPLIAPEETKRWLVRLLFRRR